VHCNIAQMKLEKFHKTPRKYYSPTQLITLTASKKSIFLHASKNLNTRVAKIEKTVRVDLTLNFEIFSC